MKGAIIQQSINRTLLVDIVIPSGGGQIFVLENDLVLGTVLLYARGRDHSVLRNHSLSMKFRHVIMIASSCLEY